MMKVNKWNEEQLKRHNEEQTSLWRERNNIKWNLNIDIITKSGYQVLVWFGMTERSHSVMWNDGRFWFGMTECSHSVIQNDGRFCFGMTERSHSVIRNDGSFVGMTEPLSLHSLNDGAVVIARLE
eukprot:1589788-Karenia_brevis.AAC.1